MLAATKLNEKTLIKGFVGIAPVTSSKIKILHEAVNSLNIDGFKITELRIFEDPLTAQIEIENSVPQKGLLAKFVDRTNYAFKDLNHSFSVNLTLTDFMQPNGGVEITYNISRRQHLKHRASDDVSISIANKMKSSLISAVQKSSIKRPIEIPVT